MTIADWPSLTGDHYCYYCCHGNNLLPPTTSSPTNACLAAIQARVHPIILVTSELLHCTACIVQFYQSEAIIGARSGYVCQVSGALSDSPPKASNFLQVFHCICPRSGCSKGGAPAGLWSPQQSTISSGQLVSSHRTLAIRHYLFSNGPSEPRSEQKDDGRQHNLQCIKVKC